MPAFPGRYIVPLPKQTEPEDLLVTQLDIFLDDDKLIRCGGRLHNAPLQDSVRLPYLLPSKHYLVVLIIKLTHITQLIFGVESTVTFLRQKYWIPSIRQRVRKIVQSCVTCRNVTGRAYRVPDPLPLPSDRLKQAPSILCDRNRALLERCK